MHIKMILPSLQEAGCPDWRPIKYSLFPPLGLATLAAMTDENDDVQLVDQHVESVELNDAPDLVVIQVYITNASRAYRMADHYRSKGCYVCLGGLHVTSLPDEALQHADTIFLGPGDDTFPEFLSDFRRHRHRRIYRSTVRTLEFTPPPRRDLIKRERYLVPNSLVVTRGCPHHCDFCYKDAFFGRGKSFYAQRVDRALGEIDRLPGRHLYFLDDHLFGDPGFARSLFEGMKGMGRLFQAASTLAAVLKDDLVERAARAGLRSLFLGFESINTRGLMVSNKHQLPGEKYDRVVHRLHDLGIKINASFVFGLDGDGPDIFARTVEWAVSRGITTATFHIATPYPGTNYFQRIQSEGRLLTRDWDQYDTRHVVFRPDGMTAQQLQAGYDWAYSNFYSWANILRSSQKHDTFNHRLRHLAYTVAWKKSEPLWNLIIKSGLLGTTRRLLEVLLNSQAQLTVQSCAVSEAGSAGGRNIELANLSNDPPGEVVAKIKRSHSTDVPPVASSRA